MRPLFIAIIGIVVLAFTLIGIFIDKVGESKQSYSVVTINGMKPNYTINEPISFSVVIEGFGSGCGDVLVTITKENDSQYRSPGWSMMPSCAYNYKLENFKFTALSETTGINQTGNYTLSILFDNLITNQHITSGTQFSVVDKSFLKMK